MATKTLKTAAPHQPELPTGNASSAVAPSKDGCGDVESKVTAGAPTDTLKKKRRAERFGMPVLLSEQEKRNFRAERFGTVSGDLLKKSEEHKRKARAERFGLEKSVLAAEEEKKKARLARFAPVLKTNLLEEGKKEARALRFSEMSSSMPQSNVTGIEPKAAITSKAGEVA